MSPLPQGIRRAFRLARRRPAIEAEVDDEVAFHLEMRAAELAAGGLAPEAARAEALRRFGDTTHWSRAMSTEDRARAAEERRSEWLHDLRHDLRYGTRALLRAPLFTLLAVVTLALGIGANAAVFGVVKSVLLDALPYARPGQLMRLYSPFGEGMEPRGALSAGTVSDIRERQHAFGSLGAFLPARNSVYQGSGAPLMVKSMFIEPQLLRTLGVRPIRGTGFRDEDGLHDTTTVAMLSYGAWQRLLGGAADAVGQTVRLGGIPRTIVGILPRDFVPPEGEGEVDYFLPLGMALAMRDPISVRGSHNFGLIGRRAPGVREEAARGEMTAIGAELEQLYPKDNLGFGLTAIPLRDAMVGDTRTPLLVLLASAALVLLITCANLAGALLSRTISRRKEFAVRVALGAGRGRLVRQLLTESVLLAVTGGVAGLALAVGGLRLLRGLALDAIPSYASLSLDTGAVLVTFALALATGIAFGLAPALSVGRADPQRTLRDQSRGASESARSRRLRGLLVAGQIALCVSLLAATGLLVRSLVAMTSAPLGIDPGHVLTFTLQPPGGTYGTRDARNQLYDRLIGTLGELPGVTSVAVTSGLPTMVGSTNGLFIEKTPWAPNEPVPFILTVAGSEAYFRTLGVPLRQGRTFSADDRPDTPPVIVINEAMARRFWPTGDAVGARIHIGPPDPDAPWLTVIGVVGDVRNDPTHVGPEPMMYLAFRQESWGNTLVVRTSTPPTALVRDVRRAIAAVDPMIPMYEVATMDQVIDDTFAVRRLPVVLMTSFGALALLLASVGVYAMFANMAAAREREFGVRVALGASPARVAALVLRQGGLWMALGLAGGAAGVVVVGRLVRGLLYGVRPFDPLSLGIAVAVLVVCGAVALAGPVRRATRVDPIMVLR